MCGISYLVHREIKQLKVRPLLAPAPPPPPAPLCPESRPGQTHPHQAKLSALERRLEGYDDAAEHGLQWRDERDDARQQAADASAAATAATAEATEARRQASRREGVGVIGGSWLLSLHTTGRFGRQGVV